MSRLASFLIAFISAAAFFLLIVILSKVSMWLIHIGWLLFLLIFVILVPKSPQQIRNGRFTTPRTSFDPVVAAAGAAITYGLLVHMVPASQQLSMLPLVAGIAGGYIVSFIS